MPLSVRTCSCDVSYSILTHFLADIKERDLPLGWYAPKNVPWELAERVARGWMPRDQDYGHDNDDPYVPSIKQANRKRAAENREAGMYFIYLTYMYNY